MVAAIDVDHEPAVFWARRRFHLVTSPQRAPLHRHTQRGQLSQAVPEGRHTVPPRLIQRDRLPTHPVLTQ